MKLGLLIIFFSVLSLTLYAAETDSVDPNLAMSASQDQTQASAVLPCANNCNSILTPGKATLGNSEGVFRPGDGPSTGPTPPPVNTDQ